MTVFMVMFFRVTCRTAAFLEIDHHLFGSAPIACLGRLDNRLEQLGRFVGHLPFLQGRFHGRFGFGEPLGILSGDGSP